MSRRSIFILAGSGAAFLALALLVWAITGGEPAVDTREVRSHTRTNSEERVRDLLLGYAEDKRDKVRFIAWGPHAAGDDVPSGILPPHLRNLKGLRALIRVKYFGPSPSYLDRITGEPFEERDSYFLVYDGMITFVRTDN